MELFFVLLCIAFIVYVFATRTDKQNQPKRRRVTRIVDIDGRVSFRGVPPGEWKALEEEYQRQEAERYNRR